MRLELAIAALAALLVALFGSASAPAASSASSPASAPSPAQRWPATAPTPASSPPRPGAAAAPHAPVPLHVLEVAVHAARLRGAGENEIHQLRASQLTSAQLESLLAMESAETSWRRRLVYMRERCGSSDACGAHLPPEERARWRSYAEPALRH